MDESEIQAKRRDNEEQATADRARILRLPYAFWLYTVNVFVSVANAPDAAFVTVTS